MTDTVELNRGSDWVFGSTLTDEFGVPINLTGYTISAFEPSPELAPHLTLSITNAAAGVWSGRVEWNAAFPNGKRMQFRIMFTLGINNETTPQIWIVVK